MGDASKGLSGRRGSRGAANDDAMTSGCGVASCWRSGEESALYLDLSLGCQAGNEALRI